MSEGVPEGWKEYTLQRVCEVVGGGTPERHTDKYWNGNICWASPTEITALRTRYISDTKDKITDLGLKNSSAKLHPVGTVLMTSRASIGFAAINTVPMATNQGFQSLRCKKQADNEFIYQWIIGNQPILERLSSGSTFSEISSTNVRTVPVVLPPKPEQQKIASILTSVDDVIEKTEAQINKLQDLKKAMMQELLTKGIGHTEFKDSPVGRIPREWEVISLAQLVKDTKPITYGIVQAGPHIENGIPYIRVSDMSGTRLFIKGMLRTSTERAAKYKRSEVNTGDIVYALRGLIGHVLKVPESLSGANLTQGTARISPNNDIVADYLLWAMRSPYIAYQTDLEVKGSTFREITLASLKKLQICVPSKEEQFQIAKILDSIEELIEAKQIKLHGTRAIKKALMQDLLTGKVRVQVN